MIDIEAFAEYLEAHSATRNTIRVYCSNGRKIISNHALDNLQQFHKFINKQRKIMAQKSFNLILTTFKAILRYADIFDIEIDDKIIKEIGSIRSYSNPIPIQERRAYSREEISKLLNDVDMKAWRWQAIWTMVSFGLRKSELRNLKVSDIDLINNRLNIRPEISKSKKYRSVPINSQNKNVILSWLNNQECETYYLELKKGKMISDRSLGTWTKINELVGFKLKAHNLRYTFATNLYLKTNDIVLVQKMLGHSNPSVTSIYLKLTREDLDTKFLEADLSFI